MDFNKIKGHTCPGWVESSKQCRPHEAPGYFPFISDQANLKKADPISLNCHWCGESLIRPTKDCGFIE